MEEQEKFKSQYSADYAILCQEPAKLSFRGEEFEYINYYYKKTDTGREFTTSESDAFCMDQIYSQYRKKHGIPTAEEIAAIRIQYDLPALAMSKILGLGDNQYRLYENGVIPSESAGRLINLAKDPIKMQELLGMAGGALSKKDFERYSSKIHAVISAQPVAGLSKDVESDKAVFSRRLASKTYTLSKKSSGERPFNH